MSENIMDESKLANKEVETTTVTTPSNTTVGESNKDWRPLYNHFNIDESATHDPYLKDIWEYAKQDSRLTSSSDILWAVQKLINKVGSSNASEPSYAKLARYVKLCQRIEDSKLIKREMEDN